MKINLLICETVGSLKSRDLTTPEHQGCSFRSECVRVDRKRAK